MDEINLEILRLLEHNGRMSHEEISKHLNISRPAIHRRITKMEDEGIIKGYKADIDWSATGQVIRAVINLNIFTKDFHKSMEDIRNIKIDGLDIESCYRVTGQWCIMLKIRAKTTDNITQLHNELLSLEGMQDTFTILILSE